MSDNKKPFYKKWWFIVLMALAAFGAVSETIAIINEESAEANESSIEKVDETNVNDIESEKEFSESLEDIQDESKQENKDEEKDLEEELSREEEIEQIIRSRAKDTSGYSGFRIDKIRANENLGDEESDTYIVLVNLTWKTKNKADTADNMIDTVSQDIAANLHNEGAEDVTEITIFTEDRYNKRDIKHSYVWQETGFVQTNHASN